MREILRTLTKCKVARYIFPDFVFTMQKPVNEKSDYLHSLTIVFD